MSNYALIKQAILEKRSVDCYYNKLHRKMSPHVLGKSKKGANQALFYQYGGESSKGLSSNTEENWRCIPIDTITGLTINNDEFFTADNHSKSQTCVDIVEVEIEYF